MPSVAARQRTVRATAAAVALSALLVGAGIARVSSAGLGANTGTTGYFNTKHGLNVPNPA